MNKRIYYRDKFIEFADDAAQFAQNQSLEMIRSLGPAGKELPDLLGRFLDKEKTQSYLLVEQDFKKVLAEIKPQFHYIEAAGGLIERNDRFLFIYRHDKWDLPKGKREKDETAEDCAIRECEEECGVRKLTIRRDLPSTWHAYEHKGGFALKKTHWFYMTTGFYGTLTPQTEEHITEVRWMNRKEIAEQALKNTYYTISDVVHSALRL